MSLPEDLTVERYMEYYLPRALDRHKERLEGIDCLLELDIRGPGGGAWGVTVRDRQAVVVRGPAPDARCVFQATASDWLDLIHGRLNGPMAFLTGRIKVEGDMLYAAKLGTMLMSGLSGAKKS